jgi:hypothetical protein
LECRPEEFASAYISNDALAPEILKPLDPQTFRGKADGIVVERYPLDGMPDLASLLGLLGSRNPLGETLPG